MNVEYTDFYVKLLSGQFLGGEKGGGAEEQGDALISKNRTAFIRTIIRG